MKKLLSALIAGAFAVTLYAAPAAACPNMDKTVTTQKEKQKDTKKKADKKKDKKKDKEKKPAKVS